jgi:hypothetical protein
MNAQKGADTYGPGDRPAEETKPSQPVRCRLLRRNGDSTIIEGDERLHITEGIARDGVIYVWRADNDKPYERIFRELKMVKVDMPKCILHGPITEPCGLPSGHQGPCTWMNPEESAEQHNRLADRVKELRRKALQEDMCAPTNMPVSTLEGRKGDWFQTIEGRQFWPFDPRPGDFSINEIAHALSQICRFNGHTKSFLSVAEHSVWVSLECDPMDAMEGLMHDASEAYLGDMIRPLKKGMPEYVKVEQAVEAAIAQQFGFRFPYPESVKRADDAVLLAERRDLLADPPKPWTVRVPAMERRVEGWDPITARTRFLDRFRALSGKANP